MKILIVDDDADKLRKLIDLFTREGVSRDDIDVARSADNARTRLKVTQYEVMILDLLLPYREEDEVSVRTSIGLLQEVSERDEYIKPRYLVGFTAFAEAESEAWPHFRENLWTIVRYDSVLNEWQEQFRRVIRYLADSRALPRRLDYGIDLCVLTTLRDPELAAVHRLPWSWEAPEPIDDSTFVRRGFIPGDRRGFTVLSACSHRMGNVAAALLTARVIARFKPRFVVMAGICAGIKRKVNLGDVVLFSPCWEWASGKVVPDEEAGSYLEPAPHQIPVSEFVISRAQELKSDADFWLHLRDGFPNHPDSLPKLVIGPAASGPSVIANADYTEAIKIQHRLLTAIDMEAYGVAAAAVDAEQPRPTTFSMKAICDFADQEKDDSYQAYAAYASATTVQGFFERYLAEIRDMAGS